MKYIEINEKKYPFKISINQVLNINLDNTLDVGNMLDFLHKGIVGGHKAEYGFGYRLFHWPLRRDRLGDLLDMAELNTIISETISITTGNGEMVKKKTPEAVAKS